MNVYIVEEKEVFKPTPIQPSPSEELTIVEEENVAGTCGLCNAYWINCHCKPKDYRDYSNNNSNSSSSDKESDST